jgi:endo-1,4-beta-xylanase
MISRFRALAAAAFAAVAYGQTPVLPPDALGGFRLLCAGGAAARVPVADQEFFEAWRIVTPSGVAREWDCRIRHTLSVAVRRNDWLVAVFWIRAVDGLEPMVRLNMERAAPDYRKSVAAATFATAEWRRLQVPFRVVEDYQPGGAAIDFWVGYDPQTVEIGGVSVLNFGPGESPPVKTEGFTYPGREANAPWREAARERIERHRMETLAVRVLDAGGAPVPQAEVRVRMRRHAFRFGSAAVAAALTEPSADNERYREIFIDWFNAAVLENDLKWEPWERNRTRALAGLRWLQERGIPVRGHTMIWPEWQYLPPDLRTLAGSPEALRSRIDRHILDIGAAAAGLVIDWDVVNEPIPNRALQDILGDQELVRWFQLARQADPEARLFVNEYDIETRGGKNTRKQRQYLDLIQWLLEQGAPLGGIGIQGHFGTDFTHPERVYEILDRFAAFGLPVAITEFDIATLDEEVQADYTRDYLTICFSHPGVDSFLVWGFWEGRHWKPEAAMLRRNWTEKPNARVWRDLIYRDWWTNADGETDAAGEFAVRGFLGDYLVEVKYGEVVVQRELTLRRGQGVLEVRLE